MATQKTLKAAMIGLRHGHVGGFGPNGSGYIGNWNNLDGVEVVAYCEDTEPALLEPAKEYHPGAHLYTSVDDLIAKEDFDLACVVLPANEVPGVGIKLAEAGKHFFMEKQFARTSVDLAELVRAVRRNKVRVMLGYMYRFHPAMRELRQIIDSGHLGRPLSIEARHITGQVRPGSSRDPKHFMYTDREEGGGMLHMLACHNLEAMRYVMGCEVKAVQAMVGRPVGHIDEPHEDLTIAAFEYENGGYGSIHVGYLFPPGGGGRDTVLIYRGLDGWASCGNLEHNPTSLEVWSTAPEWSGSPKKDFSYSLAPFGGYGGAQWFHDWTQGFIHDIRADRDPELTVEDALKVLQCIEAVYESARTGRRVEVKYGL